MDFDTWMELESTKAALTRNGADFRMHNPFLGLCHTSAMKIAFDAGKASTIKPLNATLENVAKNQKDLPPEFSKIIDRHFWDLV